MKKQALLLIYTLLFPCVAWSDEYIIGLPHAFAGDKKADLYQPVRTFIKHTMNHGDTLQLFDAYSLEFIAKVTIPNEGKAYKNPIYRQQKFSRQLKSIRQHIEQIPVAGISINVPRFLEHLANGAFAGTSPPNRQVNILVIGNAEHRELREPAFNMQNGWFPSDAYIKVSPEKSIYGTQGKQGLLTGFSISFLHINKPDEWYNELYRHRIERFWGLYIQSQGGRLVIFTPDARTAFDQFQLGNTTSVAKYTFDHTAHKMEMLRADRDGMPADTRTDGADFLNLDAPISTSPPPYSKGVIKVGTRWKCSGGDIDIYGKGSKSSPFLYFSNPRSIEGLYFKDFRTSPDAINGLEYIEFTQPIDLYEMKVLINHYSGTCDNGVNGAVRVFFDGHIYEASFHLRTTEGNKGQDRESAAASPYWHVVDIPAIVGLPKKEAIAMGTQVNAMRSRQ